MLLAVFAVLYGVWRLFDLPEEAELVALAQEQFVRYGTLAVFLSAFLEGLLFIGWYYPGGVVIFLGVSLAAGDPVRVAMAIGAVIVGLVLSHGLNYFLGRYGWYRLFAALGFEGSLSEMREKVRKRGTSAIFLSYWSPNLASLAATVAGILHYPARSFFPLSVVSATFWSGLWGVFVSLLGESALSLLSFPVILSGLALWVLYRIVRSHLGRRRDAGDVVS
jgi:membrane protein DedA with SNARE-associated domain